VNLLVQLQIVERLKHNLHKLILSDYEFLHLRVVVGIASLAAVGLAIALIVPRIHHLRHF
jgi:hypothetical protein